MCQTLKEKKIARRFCLQERKMDTWRQLVIYPIIRFLACHPLIIYSFPTHLCSLAYSLVF